MAKPKVPDCICIDFETDPIAGLRPEYPPKPVSFSIQWPADKKPKFFAWGHPSKNTTTLPKAKAELTKAVAAARQRKIPLLFFNAAFDWEIICDLLGIDIMTVDWDMIHDAMYLLFLDNPHSKSLELKPAAEALLRRAAVRARRDARVVSAERAQGLRTDEGRRVHQQNAGRYCRPVLRWRRAQDEGPVQEALP
jgi:hypothetical protein